MAKTTDFEALSVQLQEQLNVANASLEAELQAHEETKTMSLEMISQLQKQNALAAQSPGTTMPVTVTVDEKEYQIIVGAIKIGQKKITAEELAADKALCTELIQAGSGAFALVKAETSLSFAKPVRAERQGGRQRKTQPIVD